MSDNKNNKIITYLDNAIAFFFLLFLVSLTNSIFINQLGYYAALLLIIFKGWLQRKNPFIKSGLEFGFLWFITAELISMLFADKNSQAFHFMMKRVLLLPIVYTTVSAATDLKKAKLYVKIYLGASLVTVIIYIAFSIRYFIYDLYSRVESGPSIFQYPITVSEITSFTVIILFAFLVHEKTTWRNRIFLFIAFLLSSIALLSTYKRTGWMGAVFGILIVLIAKKEWKLLIPAAAALCIVVFFSSNKSEINVYNYTNGKLNRVNVINTQGRAYDITKIDSLFYISDYENGLLYLRNPSEIQTGRLNQLKLSAPVTSVKKWNDSTYVASLVDTRFVLLHKKSGKIVIGKEFNSPGITNDYEIANGALYVNDIDSGITVFKSPVDLNENNRLPSLNNYSGISADSVYFVAFKPDSGVDIYSLQNSVPIEKIAHINYNGIASFADINQDRIIISGNKGSFLYSFNNNKSVLLNSSKNLNNIIKIVSDNRTFAITSQREVIEIDSLMRKISSNTISFFPIGVEVNKDYFFITSIKRNKLLSIVDPYIPSNYTRISLWTAGIKLFEQHPVFGVGDVDIADYYRKLKQPYEKEVQGHFHNNYVHFLATLGIFGFAAIMFLFFKYITITYRSFRKQKDIPFAGSFALGVLGAFCAFLVSGLTELNFFDHEIATLLWFLFGLNAAFLKLTSDNNNK